ncbi:MULTISPECIES: GntR family transcriptional regulator [Serratia]|uniref:GntR family transcriptional regulator n=1 Tax=Serratia rhizosphaerae TaxID=2597702 RepID=A0ABX6GIK7_9GAMM|nr:MULTISPECIES: GntR family transcriptional regulator [Serratia]MBU3894171.1 GntR family transcriptional regulator [Serratia rubidaea]MCA4823203.1 GntR family transcriptional regulator [Serratia rubidaea]MEB6335753.1 GntR family transcriptional regulator [Serratia rhizosphaerae]QHA86097.1 GntR family transcriptional regulator [Serratia rhizosphaerae]QPT14792.1 GntR family transcriptional regulator [Serratia rubidaea]
MSRTQNLRQMVINQMIDGMTRGHLTSPLPSQAALAEMYNISRTTVRHALAHFQQTGVLAPQADGYVIARLPQQEECFDCREQSPEAQNERFERAFFQLINQQQLRAGDSFSELQLARQMNVSPAVVREFLLRLSRYQLVDNVKRGQWCLKTFDQHYAEQLFELRQILETHALSRFLNLPADDARWLQARELLRRHRELRDDISLHYRQFSALDSDFHRLILSAANNPFFNQSLEVISVIFHFHYQWDASDLKQRNIIAIEEHMAILSALICRNDQQATHALHRHLDSAKQSMIRSLAHTVS